MKAHGGEEILYHCLLLSICLVLQKISQSSWPILAKCLMFILVKRVVKESKIWFHSVLRISGISRIIGEFIVVIFAISCFVS